MKRENITMKQKHIFLVSIVHDEDKNHISSEIIQGRIKQDVDSVYVIDNNGNDYWAFKYIFNKFDVVKQSYFPDGHKRRIVHYNMGFIWEDGADEHYVRYMADECQRRCKLPVIERMNELRNEIDKSIENLLESKTCVII